MVKRTQMIDLGWCLGRLEESGQGRSKLTIVSPACRHENTCSPPQSLEVNGPSLENLRFALNAWFSEE